MNEKTTVDTPCKPCKIREFLTRPHTPFEKGLMIAAGTLAGTIAGIAIGFALSPLKGGIEISVGSHNGSDNQR